MEMDVLSWWSRFELSLALKQEGEKLTGAVTLPMGQAIDIKDGMFKNDEVSFITEVERNGNTFKTKYKGKVEGDTIKGTTERERNGENDDPRLGSQAGKEVEKP